MRTILIWFRDLPKDQKQKLKLKHNIKKVTYWHIKMMYEEAKK